jgi:uncharacterized protein YceK
MATGAAVTSQTHADMRILALLIALVLTAGCSYIQMQPKSGGGQATPYAPRLP